MGTVGEMVQAGGVLLGGPQITKLMAGTDEAAEAAVVTGAMSGTALVELLAVLRRLGIWDAEVLEGCAWHDEVKFTGTLLSTVEAGQRVRVIVLKGE